MIKKSILITVVLIFMAFTGYKLYRDGIYTGTSRSVYNDEPFYGSSRIVIENGKIIKVSFTVRDSTKHEYFDEKYEKYFAGNDDYILQCRNDWKGILSYPDSLLKYQDLNRVDAISGDHMVVQYI